MAVNTGKYEHRMVFPEDYGLPKSSAYQKLSPLDMNMPRIYAMRWILCFPTPPGSDKDKICNNLKLGLAHTIASVPWLAGILNTEQGSKPENDKIQIQDGSGGVGFSWHDLTDILPSYKELKEQNFPLSKLHTSQLSPLGVIPNHPARVMAAQANFIEGGLLLTIGAHHSACDGFGLDGILDLWAQNTKYGLNPTRLNVFDQRSSDRQPLMKGTPGARLSDHPEYVLIPRPAQSEVEITSHQVGSMPIELPPMSARIFYFSPESLASIKIKAAAHSTNDALSAFVWQHMTKARYPAIGIQNSGNDNKEMATALLFAANIRSRANPPLCPTYFGNASMAGITERIHVSRIVQDSGLPDAAAAIRSSVNSFSNPDRVSLTVGLIESQRRPTDLKFAYNGFLGPDISVTAWSAFSVYKQDWGILGRPEAFRVPGEGADGVVMVLPKLEDGGLEVLIGLETQAMDRLVGSAEFKSFAALWA